MISLTRSAMGDDSWITLDYARSLAENGHWGLLPDRTANTATSPLNVWLLAAGLLATGRPVLAVGAVLVTAFGAIGFWGAEIAHRVGASRGLPYLLVGLLATSPLLVSTVGMETYLGAAVLIGLASYAVANRWVPVGVLAGVAVLARPDLAVPAGVVLSVLLTAHRWRAAVLAAAVALPWHLWSWFVLGGLVPDTFAFKTVKASGQRLDMATSIVTYYWVRMPITTVVTAILVLGGMACAAWWTVGGRATSRRGRTAITAVIAGTAHWVALEVIGAYPQGWYFGPLVVGSALAIAVTAASTARSARPIVGAYCMVALLTAGVGGVPWGAASMNSNWAHPSEYARIGTEVGTVVGSATVASPGEIGELAYFCRCAIVDQFSDSALAWRLVEARRDQAGTLTHKALTLNSWNRDPGLLPPLPDYRLVFLQEPAQALPPRTIRWWWIDPPSIPSPYRLALIAT